MCQFKPTVGKKTTTQNYEIIKERWFYLNI